ncbi:MAG TPA: cupin domain-containing protein [Acidimicrobiia bacterium]|nr:cupin domain-containing protein [Acidimicrobiia bacterium]
MTSTPRTVRAMSVWTLALLVLPLVLTAQDGQLESNGPAVFEPEGGDRLWVFAESPDELGSGGEFHIYVDPDTHPEAKASFAKFSLGPGGQLPVHRHDKTEEISYFVSGTGLVQTIENGEAVEVPVAAGHVWYVPPGAWHAIRNTGEVPLTLVFATIPNEKKGLLSFFRRIGARPGQEPTPIAPEEFATLAAEHDLILRPAEPPEE